MKKIMTAMSGGVDSSVTAALLKESGYNVCGGTLRLYETNNLPSKEVELAKSVCDRLKIDHFVFDKRETFLKEVINRFSREYNDGLTPNPCIECNKYIKFGVLLDEAVKEDCSFIATGHYSRIKKDTNSRYVLYRPQDIKKDQTYVLWRLSQYQLSHILMPLGDITKEEVRKIASDYGFISVSAKESQDICFVPDGNYAAFLQSLNGKAFEKGKYTDMSGNVLGEHSGHQCYTIGQRKGLGIALGKPQFVISKNPSANEVVLGDEEHIFKKRIYIKDVNMIAADMPSSPVACTAKLRYSAKDEKCLLHPLSETEALLEFEKPQRAATPGQSAVFYSLDAVLGGGKIVKGE